jgi:hypothetical protein
LRLWPDDGPGRCAALPAGGRAQELPQPEQLDAVQPPHVEEPELGVKPESVFVANTENFLCGFPAPHAGQDTSSLRSISSNSNSCPHFLQSYS